MQFVLRNWSFGLFNRPSKMGESLPKSEGNSLLNILRVWESKLMTLQSLLIWEDPKLSIAYLFVYSALFWSVLIVNMSLITVLSIVCLMLFLSHEWVGYIWPEISVHPEAEEIWTTLHPNIMSVNELSIYLENLYTKMIELFVKIALFRTDHPGIFCALNVANFLILLIIGSLVPGCILAYIVITVIAAIPGISLHVTPPVFLQSIYTFYCTHTIVIKKVLNCSEKCELEEFIPDGNPADISKVLDIGIPDNDQSTFNLRKENISNPSLLEGSDDDDIFTPVANKKCSKNVSGHPQQMPDFLELDDEARKFEDSLAELADKPSSKVQQKDEWAGGNLTWFNKDLYNKIVGTYFNMQTSEDSNSSDSS